METPYCVFVDNEREFNTVVRYIKNKYNMSFKFDKFTNDNFFIINCDKVDFKPIYGGYPPTYSKSKVVTGNNKNLEILDYIPKMVFGQFNKMIRKDKIQKIF